MKKAKDNGKAWGKRCRCAPAATGQGKWQTGAAGLLSLLGTQAEIKAHGFGFLCVDVRALERRSLQPVVACCPTSYRSQYYQSPPATPAPLPADFSAVACPSLLSDCTFFLFYWDQESLQATILDLVLSTLCESTSAI